MERLLSSLVHLWHIVEQSMAVTSQHIVLDKAEFQYDSGVLLITFNTVESDKVVSIPTLERYADTIVTLCNNKRTPFLIDVSEAWGSYSVAAARYFAKSERLFNVRLADAFVAKETRSVLSIRSFKRIYDPFTPYQICNTYDEARQFCDRYVADYSRTFG
ncbi:hypothetical protein [Gilvibacter sp.]|uniref:DUF7793 family protein n=1 Tax=Gilvibacter sp. TaxID=2729997 RepID=UPI0025BDDC32|nr:hypothetical protein [Gilvibacter sp.]